MSFGSEEEEEEFDDGGLVREKGSGGSLSSGSSSSVHGQVGVGVGYEGWKRKKGKFTSSRPLRKMDVLVVGGGERKGGEKKGGMCVCL